jgi:phage major head subunit gpT-like protein
MKISSASLDALRVGFQASFQGGIDMATKQSGRVAFEIPSTTKEERLGWLGKMPNVREWLGDRQIQNFNEYDYTIKNKDWELTIGVDRNAIEDDTFGIYNPLFAEMGQSTGGHLETLLFSALKNGFTSKCFDGQNFFDTVHPVLNADGSQGTYANTDGGGGTPWFLMASKRTIKPIVWTNRKPYTFVAKDKLTDDNVFMKKEFVYGADARYNVGYGFPQLCWGSKQLLAAGTYATARAGIMAMKGDYGRPIGLVPDLLVVPPNLEQAARQIVKNMQQAGGATNEWFDTAEVAVVPWLS